MRRFLVLAALFAFTLPVVANLAVAADEPVPLQVEKECVLIGRIVDRTILLYPLEPSEKVDIYNPPIVEMKGFEVLNTETGEWHQLAPDEDGYFCANVGKGKYELRGRDSEMKPFVIHRFNIPRGMAVNLGTFRVETAAPDIVAREKWYSYVKAQGWAVYEEGANAVSLRLRHVATDRAYEDCESWFASCHEDASKYFAGVMARR